MALCPSYLATNSASSCQSQNCHHFHSISARRCLFGSGEHPTLCYLVRSVDLLFCFEFEHFVYARTSGKYKDCPYRWIQGRWRSCRNLGGNSQFVVVFSGLFNVLVLLLDQPGHRQYDPSVGCGSHRDFLVRS